MSYLKKFCVLGLVFSLSPAWANDAGDLIFSGDHPRRARVELLYENVERRIDITSENPDLRRTFDADVFALRIQSAVTPTARLDFDIGAMSAGGGNNQLMGGVGLRFLAFEEGAWRGGTFAQVRYTEDLRDRFDLRDAENQDARFDLVEGDAGFLISYHFPVAGQFHITPYGGPVASVLRLSGRTGEGETRERFRARQDQILGVVAGVGFQFADATGLRIEFRYFDEFSVSAAAALTF